MNAKGFQQGLVLLAVILLLVFAGVGIYFLRPQFPFMAWIAEAEMQSRLYLGNDVNKVLAGEKFRAYLDVDWINRWASTTGGQKVGFAWFLDGEFKGTVGGATDSISQVFCEGFNPSVGCISEQDFKWDTLQYAMVLPPQGSTASDVWAKEFDSGDLELGEHELEVRVYPIQKFGQFTAKDLQNVFACEATLNGACCPLGGRALEACIGIHGTTQLRFKTEDYVVSTPDGFTVPCGGLTTTQCRDTYCQKDWCGGDWCLGTAPANCWVGFCACANGVKTQWSGWGAWREIEAQTKETATELIAVAPVLDSIKFKVVEMCPFECCVELEDYLDKPCLEHETCVAGECQVVKQACPFDCCQGEELFHDKGCPQGTACQNNFCIAPPPPPPPVNYTALAILLILLVIASAYIYLKY